MTFADFRSASPDMLSFVDIVRLKKRLASLVRLRRREISASLSFEGHPFVQNMSTEQVEALAALVTIRSFYGGDVMIEEGTLTSRNDVLFLIMWGTATVSLDGSFVKKVSAGDAVGTTVIGGLSSHHLFTVTTKTYLRTFCLPRLGMLEILTENDVQIIAEGVREQLSTHALQQNWHEILCAKPPISYCSAPCLASLAPCCTTHAYPARAEFPSDGFIVVRSGKCVVTCMGHVCQTLSPGDSFGEVSLFREDDAYTREYIAIRAVTDSIIVALSQEFLSEALEEFSTERLYFDDLREERETTIARIIRPAIAECYLFENVADAVVTRIANTSLVTVESFDAYKGVSLVHDAMAVVQSGQVVHGKYAAVLLKNHGTQYRKGDFFGIADAFKSSVLSEAEEEAKISGAIDEWQFFAASEGATVIAIPSGVVWMALNQYRSAGEILAKNAGIRVNFTPPALSEFPFFSEKSVGDLIAFRMQLVWCVGFPGQPLIVDGTDGSFMVLVGSGECTVTKHGNLVAVVPPPATFGEMSMLGMCSLRQCGVQMSRLGLYAVVTKSVFSAAIPDTRSLFHLANERLRVLKFLRKRHSEHSPSMAERLEADALMEDSSITMEVEIVIGVSRGVFLNCSSEFIKAAMTVLEIEVYMQGDIIVREGDLASTIYVIRVGRVHCFTQKQYVGTLVSKACFGEMALDNKSVARTTVKAEELTVCAIFHASSLAMFAEEFPEDYNAITEGYMTQTTVEDGVIPTITTVDDGEKLVKKRSRRQDALQGFLRRMRRKPRPKATEMLPKVSKRDTCAEVKMRKTHQVAKKSPTTTCVRIPTCMGYVDFSSSNVVPDANSMARPSEVSYKRLEAVYTEPARQRK